MSIEREPNNSASDSNFLGVLAFNPTPEQPNTDGNYIVEAEVKAGDVDGDFIDFFNFAPHHLRSFRMDLSATLDSDELVIFFARANGSADATFSSPTGSSANIAYIWHGLGVPDSKVREFVDSFERSVNFDVVVVNGDTVGSLQPPVIEIADSTAVGDRYLISVMLGTAGKFSTDRGDFVTGALDQDYTLFINPHSGVGIDKAVFSGAQNNYTLTLSPNATTIDDRRSDGNGSETLNGNELLEFNGETFNLDQFSGTAELSETEFENFIELYIAYFNRAPDAVGLNFWGTAFANGMTLQEAATRFVDQDETREAYPAGTTNKQFAEAVYNNVLGRAAEPEGLAFWVDQLDNGDVSRDQFILEVLGGVPAGSSDRGYLDTKVDIGAYFAVHKGMSDGENAVDAMALFDGTETSIDTTIAAIDSYHADALDPTAGEFLMPVVGVLDNPFSIA